MNHSSVIFPSALSSYAFSYASSIEVERLERLKRRGEDMRLLLDKQSSAMPFLLACFSTRKLNFFFTIFTF